MSQTPADESKSCRWLSRTEKEGSLADDYGCGWDDDTTHSSAAEPDGYGWFDELEHPIVQKPSLLNIAQSLPQSRSETPLYVLASSTETQTLWHMTAGQRPKQPLDERAKIEKLWAANFLESKVEYKTDPLQLTQTVVPPSELNNGTLVMTGKSRCSRSVTKAFVNHSMPSITLHMPYFRVIQTAEGEHAEFIVMVTITSNGPISYGIWRRHSDFSRLADCLQSSLHCRSFCQTIQAWQEVQKHQGWLRNLTCEYLATKCCLLERMIQSLLIESSSPHILNSFLGLD